MSVKRTRVITEEQYVHATRAATRAALASFDASFERYSRVVKLSGVDVAAGRLENVSTLDLRDLVKDVNHELQRRDKAST